MNIGYDLDGTLADFTHGFNKKLRRVNPGLEDKVLEDDELPYYNFSVWYGEYNTKEAWKKVFDDVNFYTRLQDDPKADLSDVKNLYDHKDTNIYFLTSREHPHNVDIQTRRWLNQRRIEGAKIRFTGMKGVHADMLNLDFYIDNNPKDLYAVKNKSDAKVYALHKPYNYDSGIQTVDTVTEFNNIVRQYL